MYIFLIVEQEQQENSRYAQVVVSAENEDNAFALVEDLGMTRDNVVIINMSSPNVEEIISIEQY